MITITDAFKNYLDNSKDSETLTLELQNLPELELMYEIACNVDFDDTMLLSKTSSDFVEVEETRQTLFNLVRNVWDIAYSYGLQDGQAEAGLTLEEQED